MCRVPDIWSFWVRVQNEEELLADDYVDPKEQTIAPQIPESGAYGIDLDSAEPYVTKWVFGARRGCQTDDENKN